MSFETRVLSVARYIVEVKCTVREAGAKFGIAKSTVHNDMVKRLPHIDVDLAKEVDAILKYNLGVRHLRGGEMTKQKYAQNHKDIKTTDSKY